MKCLFAGELRGGSPKNQARQGQVFTKPWRLETGWFEYYCTSTVMVWLAATRS